MSTRKKITDMEAFAAKMVALQDSGNYASNKNEVRVLENYKKYWIEDTAQGHLIKICYGEHDKVLEIDCRWKNRKRDKTNRVNNVKIKNYT